MGNQNEVRKNFGQRASEYRLSTTHGNPEDLERITPFIIGLVLTIIGFLVLVKEYFTN